MTTPCPDTTSASIAQDNKCFPPGLVGGVASYLLASAPRPVNEIALAGAYAFLAGICGNAYNIKSAGLNQYILILASTGLGKELVADGVSALVQEIWYNQQAEPFPHSGAELVSASGTIKLMNRNPCNLTIVGEFGKKLKGMTDPRNSVLYPISRVILQMYSKSGRKGVFDPLAYSDADKVTKRIIRPSLTIFGESVPESFYDILDEGLIADGLLSRFMVWDVKAKRTYFNESAKNIVPDPTLVNNLQNFVAHSNAIRASKSGVFEVPLEEAAEALFRQYDIWTTDEINGSGAEVSRQLWNRAHLKAMKLAALEAVCKDWINPVVTLAQAKRATDLIAEQTNNLIARYLNGEFGEVAGDENKQLNAITSEIKSYIDRPFNDDADPKFGVTFQMHRNRVITQTYLSRKLLKKPAFKGNLSVGGTGALHKSLKALVDADILRPIPKSLMQSEYGTLAVAFTVTHAISLSEGSG